MTTIYGLCRKGYRLYNRLPGLARKHILFSCFPKSASSYVSRNVASAMGFRYRSLTEAPNSEDIRLMGEQNLSVVNTIRCMNMHTVSQAHCPANASNIYVVNNFAIKNIVLTRDIFDVVVSLHDHMLNDPNQSNHSACVPHDFLTFSRDEQFDFIIRMIIPWYFKFYVSWAQVEQNRSSRLLWLTYEEMKADEISFFERVFDFCDIQPPADLQQRLRIDNQPAGRMNRGVSGRGEILSGKQRDDIISLTRFYPGIDFTRMGIASSPES